MIPTLPWARLHGASTHFPIALSFAALACDAAAVILWSKPVARSLGAAGFWSIEFAAAGSIAAVGSGLFLTHGETWGAGDLGRHHRFVWPAFCLLIGAAAWRWRARGKLTRRTHAVYLGALLATAAMVGAAGYAGGELLQGLP